MAAHLDSLRVQVEAAKTMRALFANAHSGRDAWSEAESAQYFEGAVRIEKELGLPIAHETHRSRILFNPWITARMVASFPDLKLCADFSHWVCVSERLLDDQEEALRACAPRCLHIHARVGHEQGPQVPDPRAPEYRRHLEAHERWWGWIWDAREAAGAAVSTLTPEFGPPTYLQTLPYTQAPVADVWEICEWQAKRQVENFSRRRAGPAAAGAR